MKKTSIIFASILAFVLAFSVSGTFTNNTVEAASHKVVYVANQSQSAIQRIDFSTSPASVETFSLAFAPTRVKVVEQTLYWTDSASGIHAADIQSSGLGNFRSLGSLTVASTYAGADFFVGNGFVLTAGQCGVARFNFNGQAITFDRVVISGMDVAVLLNSNDKAYFVTGAGAVGRIKPSGRLKDTGLRVERPSAAAFDSDGMFVGGISRDSVVGIQPICATSDTPAQDFHPGSVHDRIVEGKSGLVLAMSGDSQFVAQSDALHLDPTPLGSRGLAVRNGKGFVNSGRPNEQPGTQVFSFNRSGAVSLAFETADVLVDLAIQ